MERGRRVLKELAPVVGAKLQTLQESPTFVRCIFESQSDALVVDLAVDSGVQLSAAKERFGDVVVDPVSEILANKLTALVGRQEERDLVDVYCLEQSGLSVEDHLQAAEAKGDGCTPATLAWLLSSFPLPGEDRLPEGGDLPNHAHWRDESWCACAAVRCLTTGGERLRCPGLPTLGPLA